MTWILIGSFILAVSAVASNINCTWWKRTAIAQQEVILEQQEIIHELQKVVAGKAGAKVYETRGHE